MKAMNLSSFKKIKEDKHSATMIHKDGHKMIIAKGSLPAIQKKQLEKLPMYADGGTVDDDSLVGGSDMSTPSDQSPAQPDPAPAPDTSDAQRAPASDPAPAAPDQPQMMPSSRGLQEEKAANMEAAKAASIEGIAKSDAIDDVQSKIDALPTQADIINANKAKSDALAQAVMNKQINPDEYWQSHSKIAAGIGMMLGGIGGGISGHGGNVGLDVVNQGINRDIEKQKNSQDNSMNLWKMNRQALGDDLSANLATQNQMLTMAKVRLQQASANSQGPMAIAAAHQANARIDQQIAVNNMKLATNQPTKDGIDPAVLVGQKLRLGMISQGDADKALEEIKNAQNTTQIAGPIMDAAQQAANEVRPISGSGAPSPTAFNPFQESPAQKKFSGLMNTTVKEVEGTARQAAFDSIQKNMRPQGWDNDGTIESKANTTQEYLKSKASAPVSKSIGIDLTQFPSTDVAGALARHAAAKQQAQKIQTSQSGASNKPAMVRQNGHVYNLNPKTGKYE